MHDAPGQHPGSTGFNPMVETSDHLIDVALTDNTTEFLSTITGFARTAA